jgi:hypothetical protein
MIDETRRQARVLAHAMLDDGEDVIRIIECLETRFGLPPRVAEDIVERAQEER